MAAPLDWAKRRAAKARAYHRKRCMRFVDWNGVTRWRFILNPGGTPLLYTEYWIGPPIERTKE